MELHPKKTLSEFTKLLSEPSEFFARSTCDMRTTRARKLKWSCHFSHWAWGWDRNRGRARYRIFVTKQYCNALTLTDKDFNKLINALATIKKFNL